HICVHHAKPVRFGDERVEGATRATILARADTALGRIEAECPVAPRDRLGCSTNQCASIIGPNNNSTRCDTYMWTCELSIANVYIGDRSVNQSQHYVAFAGDVDFVKAREGR